MARWTQPDVLEVLGRQMRDHVEIAARGKISLEVDAVVEAVGVLPRLGMNLWIPVGHGTMRRD